MGFRGFLKADTQVIVNIGPFVDVTDGYTCQTDIDISAADSAKLLAHGSATVVDLSGNTWAALANADGWYSLTLTAGNLGTEGMVSIMIEDVSDCRPVESTFMVVNANVFDSLFAVAATDYLRVDLYQVLGVLATATSNLLDVNTKTITDAIIKAATLAADCITNSKIADDAFAVEQFKDAFLTAAKLGADCITNAKIADNALAVEQFKDAFLTAAKLAGDAITNAKIADNAFAVEQFKDACLTRDKVPFLTAVTGKAELSSPPAVAGSIEDQIQMLFQCLIRNKWTSHKNAGGTFEIRFFNDAGAEIMDRKACSGDDDGVDLTEITSA